MLCVHAFFGISCKEKWNNFAFLLFYFSWLGSQHSNEKNKHKVIEQTEEEYVIYECA